MKPKNAPKLSIPPKNAPGWDIEPIWEPIATMVARGAERPEFNFNDRVLAAKLYREITKKKKLEWTLHSKLNIPKCRDELSCSICTKYVEHVEEARGFGGRRRGDEEEEEEEEDDDDDDDEDGYEEGPGEDLDMGVSSMDCLFKLQDLLGKSRSSLWSDAADRKIMEASGILNKSRYLQAKEQLAATQILLASAKAEVKQLGDEGNTDLRPRKQPKTVEDTLPLAPEPLSPEDKVWKDLNQMRRPAVTDSDIDIAHFLQFNEEVDFKGIPLRGAQFMVDMRDVRGYRQVMGRAPRKIRVPDNNYQHAAHCIARILQILTIPGEYERLLKEQGVTVIAAEDLTPCDFGESPAALSNHQVARLLADRGLSLAVADDAWQFCRNYVQAQVASPDPFFDKGAMKQLLQDVGPRTAPGLKPIDDDMYPRSIPSKRRYIGGQQQSTSRRTVTHKPPHARLHNYKPQSKGFR
ncbi:hypothetical protein B0H11DRAFT_2254977 [Mycena galericulata]|nr:hypothetical protein B0H11DRAFT_2254977 [Mycena galericulata]